VLFNFIILFIVVLLDRRRLKDYVLLSALGLAFALIFENVTTFLGFWYYHSEPKILLLSLYSWLLYIPYLGFCYFIGGKLGGKE
jgi:ABC-type enterochelin transport system permease subunit